jgi:hypothetical protein
MFIDGWVVSFNIFLVIDTPFLALTVTLALVFVIVQLLGFIMFLFRLLVKLGVGVIKAIIGFFV